MSGFNKVTREYPAVSMHQRVDLKAISEMGMISPELDEQLQELIDIVCEHKLLQTVENERIHMEQDGTVTMEGKVSDLEDTVE